jgi:hypothetical protein
MKRGELPLAKKLIDDTMIAQEPKDAVYGLASFSSTTLS